MTVPTTWYLSDGDATIVGMPFITMVANGRRPKAPAAWLRKVNG
jgi:hypothetical protein